MTNRKHYRIVTSYVFPPIPDRSSDWCAYYDNLGADCSPYGWGATEEEAIADLNDQEDDQ